MPITTNLNLSRYSTWELDEMIAQIERPNPWLLRTFFSEEKYFSTAAIEFDVYDRGRRLAPFVSPLVAGKPMRLEGYRTKQIKPAYIKPIALVTPQESFTRRPGEPYGGQLSPQERFDRLVTEHLDNHIEMVDNRLEWMAASALVNGGITITGEDYPTTYVDFGRSSSLSIALTGAARWNQATSTPMADIENAALQVRLISKGALVEDLVMDGMTWNLLKAHASVQDLVSDFYRRHLPGQQATAIDMAPRNTVNGDAILVGSLNGRFRLWVYDAYYEDDTGTNVALIPPYTVLGMSSAIQGRQYYGAILDLDAGIEPRKIFSKSEKKFNPSALELVSQSAPLVAPRRPNAMFKLTIA